jgi:hypothetical protein
MSHHLQICDEAHLGKYGFTGKRCSKAHFSDRDRQGSRRVKFNACRLTYLDKRIFLGKSCLPVGASNGFR